MPAGPQTFVFSDTEAKKNWDAEINLESVWGKAFFDPRYGFSGSDKNRLLVETNEFKKYGGQVTLVLAMQMTGDGFVDGEPQENTGSSYKTFPHTFEIHELTSEHFENKSQYTEQQVEWDVAETGKDFVAEWWNVPLNTGPMAHLTGATFGVAMDYYKPNDRQVRFNTAQNQYNGMNTVTAQDRLIRPSLAEGAAADHATDQAVAGDSTAVMSLALINRLIATGLQAKPTFKPVRWAGGEGFISFIHTDDLDNLIDDTKYDAIEQAVLQGGLPYGQSNYATGDSRPYRGVTFIVSNWNTPGVHSTTGLGVANTRRGAFCAAGALAGGWGVGHGQNRFIPKQGFDNRGHTFWCHSTAMWGIDRSIYNNKSLACIAYTTYAKNVGDV